MIETKSTVFKIKRNTDGLFWTGGHHGRWAKGGKIYSTHSLAQRVLRKANECWRETPMKNISIIEYELHFKQAYRNDQAK